MALDKAVGRVVATRAGVALPDAEAPDRASADAAAGRVSRPDPGAVEPPAEPLAVRRADARARVRPVAAAPEQFRQADAAAAQSVLRVARPAQSDETPDPDSPAKVAAVRKEPGRVAERPGLDVAEPESDGRARRRQVTAPAPEVDERECRARPAAAPVFSLAAPTRALWPGAAEFRVAKPLHPEAQAETASDVIAPDVTAPDVTALPAGAASRPRDFPQAAEWAHCVPVAVVAAESRADDRRQLFRLLARRHRIPCLGLRPLTRRFRRQSALRAQGLPLRPPLPVVAQEIPGAAVVQQFRLKTRATLRPPPPNRSAKRMVQSQRTCRRRNSGEAGPPCPRQ